VFKKMADKKNLPYAKMRSGGISIAIFKNKISGKDGKGDFEVDSLQLQKSWKKQDSKDWDSASISLRKSDLIKLKVVIDKAIQELFLNKDDKEDE
jgi:hypothetical protein